MWQSSYNNLVVLKVKAKLKPPSLTVKGSGLLNKPPSLTNNRVGIQDLVKLEAAEMFKCSVSGTGFVQTNIKVQGRDKGYSLAYDYDNKTMTLTNDSNIYTIYSKNEW